MYVDEASSYFSNQLLFFTQTLTLLGTSLPSTEDCAFRSVNALVFHCPDDTQVAEMYNRKMSKFRRGTIRKRLSGSISATPTTASSVTPPQRTSITLLVPQEDEANVTTFELEDSLQDRISKELAKIREQLSVIEENDRIIYQLITRAKAVSRTRDSELHALLVKATGLTQQSTQYEAEYEELCAATASEEAQLHDLHVQLLKLRTIVGERFSAKKLCSIAAGQTEPHWNDISSLSCSTLASRQSELPTVESQSADLLAWYQEKLQRQEAKAVEAREAAIRAMDDARHEERQRCGIPSWAPLPPPPRSDSDSKASVRPTPPLQRLRERYEVTAMRCIKAKSQNTGSRQSTGDRQL